MIESPKVEPTVEDVKGERWSKRKGDLEEMAKTFGPGFEPAGPRFAAPSAPMSRSVQETVQASFSEGLTADIFRSNDRGITQADPDFNVAEYMRPQDYQYVSEFALAPDLQKVHELQEDVDKRNNNYAIISARPWVSFFATMADPTSLAIDLATFGVGHALTVPLLANTLRRTQAGIKAFEAAQAYPTLSKIGREALVGAQAGVTSVYAQEQIKAATNPLHSLEDIGTHTFFAGLIGGILGGTVGFIGRNKTQKITNDFIEGNNVTQHVASAPDFMGPPRPPAAPKFDIRASLKEEPVIKTPEQIKSGAAALELEAGIGGEPVRAAEYASLRQKLSYIGESLANKDSVAGRLFRLVTAPIRNMSATNRLITSPFGIAKLKALYTARNATEVMGTRQGFVVPRSAQNRIEDLGNQAVAVNIDLYERFLKANGIEPGVGATEKLAIHSKSGKLKWKEEDFYNSISEAVLYVGKEKPPNKNFDPHIEAAAGHVYDNLYKPISDILKEYGLIPKDAGAEEAINYLNRKWSPSKLLRDPEGFKKWLGDYYKSLNEELKSALPAYEKALKEVEELRAFSKEFEKAADEIDKLKASIKKLEGDKKEKAVFKLEFLQKKYSRAGFEATAERMSAERMAESPFMKFASEKEKNNFILEAKRKEKESIESLPVVDEARVMAKELEEGAEIALEKAEEIIPARLRHSETGEPRKPWDSNDIEAPYNQAEKTFYTMIGQENEMSVNPVMSALGKPGRLKARTLDMPDNYPGIENWVERDIRVLINNFTSGVSPAIARTEMMNELNGIPIIQQTIKRMQVKKHGATKALGMEPKMESYLEIPNVIHAALTDEKRLMEKGMKGEELIKLNKQYNKAIQNLKTQDQQIDGIFGNGLNIHSSDMVDFIDVANSAVSTVTTNNIVISMLSDLATQTLKYGFKALKGHQGLLQDPFIRDMTKGQAKSLNAALNVGKGSIIKNRMVGRESSLRNSKLGVSIQNFSSRLQAYTGSNGIQDVAENTIVCFAQTNMLEMAERAALGTLTKKEATRLAQLHLSVEDAKSIYGLYRQYGWEKSGARGIDPGKIPDFEAASNKTYVKFQNFISDEIRTASPRPGIGSMPDISYSATGHAILYLKKWFLAFTNDALVPAVQRSDQEALEGFSTLFAIGALQAELRKIYRGEDRKEFNAEGFITEALTNSGLLGIYSFGLDLGLASGIIAGMGGARYDPSNGVASIIGGPGIIGYSDRTLNILGRLRKISTDEDRQFSYGDWNYMANTAVPLYKWAPISSVVKPNVKEYFESIDRGNPQK